MKVSRKTPKPKEPPFKLVVSEQEFLEIKFALYVAITGIHGTALMEELHKKMHEGITPNGEYHPPVRGNEND